MKTWNSFHLRRLMQAFVDVGILASLFFAAVSGYATTLYWDTNGSAPGSGNAGGNWNTNTYWTTDSTGASATDFYANLASATNDIYFSAGTDGVGTFAVTNTVNVPYTVNKLVVEEGKVTVQGSTSARTLTLAGVGEINVASGATLYSSVQMNGTVGFTKTGAGTLQKMGNADSYTGTTWIKEGTYSGGNNYIPDSSRLLIDVGATVTFGNRSDTVGSLAGAGTFQFGGSSGSIFTCGGDNTSTEFSGKINDSSSFKGGLVKAGTGTLKLSGANTYRPQTTVTNGVLDITGTHTITTYNADGGNYFVNASATLAGTGTITLPSGKSVTLTGTGTGAELATLAPGDNTAANTIGTFTANTTVVFGDYSNLAIEISGGSVDKLAATSLDLSSANDYLAINATGATSNRYVFATYTGSLNGNTFDHVSITGLPGAKIDYSSSGEIAVIIVRGTLISIF